MKKWLLVAALAAGVLGMAMVAGASTSITNWCTSTYELTGQAVAATGMDSAIVVRQSVPNILVSKWATNLRTGQTSDYTVNAVQNDTVEYAVNWQNTGEADAETVVLSDYVPGGMNFNALTVGETIVNGVEVSYAQAGGLVQFVATAVGGTDAGVGSGGFRFTVIVQ